MVRGSGKLLFRQRGFHIFVEYVGATTHKNRPLALVFSANHESSRLTARHLQMIHQGVEIISKANVLYDAHDGKGFSPLPPVCFASIYHVGTPSLPIPSRVGDSVTVYIMSSFSV